MAREEPKEWLGSEWYWALTHGTGHVSPDREFGERCWPPNFVFNLTHVECIWDSAVGIRRCFFGVFRCFLRSGCVDRRGAGRGSKDGLTCIVPAVSQECLFVGLALHPVPAQEPLCNWEGAVLEEYFFTGCYRVLRDCQGKGTCGLVVST